MDWWGTCLLSLVSWLDEIGRGGYLGWVIVIVMGM